MADCRTFPADDAEFGRYVRDCLEAIEAVRSADVAGLQLALRARYRLAVVHRQTPLGAAGRELVLYAYRDGHAVTTGTAADD